MVRRDGVSWSSCIVTSLSSVDDVMEADFQMLFGGACWSIEAKTSSGVLPKTNAKKTQEIRKIKIINIKIQIEKEKRNVNDLDIG